MAIGTHTLPTEIMSSCDKGMLWCFADWAYDVSLGSFWTFMLLAFSVALMMATARMGRVRSFGFGSFVGMIGAVWLAIMQLMPWWIASAFILTGIIGVVMMLMAER